MSKFTDAVATALKAHFETGDQPTAAQFAELIDKIQQGLEEHTHAGLGDGEAANVAAGGIADRTRKVFILADHGYNVTSGADLFRVYSGVPLPSDEEAYARAEWRVPADFVSGLSIAVVVDTPAGPSGDVYVYHENYYGAVGESYSTHSVTVGPAAVTVQGNQIAEIQSLNLASAAVGDYVQVWATRYGANAGDTFSGELKVHGWLATYTADS